MVIQRLNVQESDSNFSKSIVVELFLQRKYPSCEWRVGSYSYANGHGIFAFSRTNTTKEKEREASESLALSIYERVHMFSLSKDRQNLTCKVTDLLDDVVWKNMIDDIVDLVQVQLVLSE